MWIETQVETYMLGEGKKEWTIEMWVTGKPTLMMSTQFQPLGCSPSASKEEEFIVVCSLELTHQSSSSSSLGCFA